MNEKIEKYFRILHPEYDSLSPKGKGDEISDKIFIEDNIDIIHRKFKEYVLGKDKAGRTVDEEEILRNIFNSIKNEQITIQQIGKATINTPTTAKKEAEQVENGENTRDNKKEGEEVRDDN